MPTSTTTAPRARRGAARTPMPDYKIPAVRTGLAGNVRAVWLPQRGPVFGMLRFGSGHAHESLATAGINHVVEHLALSTIARGELEFNGYVDMTTTNFYTSGDRADVVRFLRDVCAALHDLPLDRLEAELRVLRVESMQRPSTEAQAHMGIRFGSVGYGLTYYREFGFDTLTPETIRDHVRRNFTADNAVLSLTGSPRGVSLELPTGEQLALPPADAAINSPGWIRTTDSMLVASWLTERSHASSRYLEMIASRMSETLRHEQGAAYSTESDIQRFGDRHHSVLVSTVLPELRNEATVEFVKVLTESEITNADIERFRKRAHKAASSQVPPAPYWLDLAANDLLREGELRDMHQEMKDMWSLTAKDFNDYAELARATTLLSVPEGSRPGEFRLVEAKPADAVAGRTFRPALRRWKADNRVSAVVGDSGVMLKSAKDQWSVRWDDVTGVLKYNEGQRILIERSGRVLTFLPTNYIGGLKATELIDQHTPDGAAIALPNDDGPVSNKNSWAKRLTTRSELYLIGVTALLLFWTYICVSLIFEERDFSYVFLAAPSAWYGFFSSRELGRRVVRAARKTKPASPAPSSDA